MNIKVNAVDSLLLSVSSARVLLNLVAFQLARLAAFPFSVDKKKLLLNYSIIILVLLTVITSVELKKGLCRAKTKINNLSRVKKPTLFFFFF